MTSTAALLGLPFGAATAFDAVFYAWEAWDQMPADRYRTVQLSEAVDAWAAELGLPRLVVRRLMHRCHSYRRPYDETMHEIEELAAANTPEALHRMVRTRSEAA